MRFNMVTFLGLNLNKRGEEGKNVKKYHDNLAICDKNKTLFHFCILIYRFVLLLCGGIVAIQSADKI